MENKKTEKNLKDASLQTFILPDDFCYKLQSLEIDLHEGKLNHEGLKELFELYSNASSFYEAKGCNSEFQYYIQKMQDLVKNEKTQSLLKRKKSRLLVEAINVTVQDKKEKIDKIKTLLKENRNGDKSKQVENNILDTAKKTEKAELIMNNDINNQEENFKKRLEEKRIQRGYSQPHMKLKSKFENKNLPQIDKDEEKEISNNTNQDKFLNKKLITVSESNKMNSEKNHNNDTDNFPVLLPQFNKKPKTPPKRQSFLAQNTFGTQNVNIKFNINNNIVSNTEKKANAVDDNEMLNHVNEILDKEYDEKIQSYLLKIWRQAEEIKKNDLFNIEMEMEKFLSELIDEKYSKTIEINNKFDAEINNLETEADFSDMSNINTIIYYEVKADKEKEISSIYKELEEKKKNGLQDLRLKSILITSEVEQINHVSIIQSEITNVIRNKIIKSLCSNVIFNKNIELTRINEAQSRNNKKENGSESSSGSSWTGSESASDIEKEDEVNLNSVQLSQNLKYKNSVELKSKQIVKPSSASKRISRGFLRTSNDEN